MTALLDQVLQEYGLAEKCKIRDPLKVESVLKRLVTDGSTKLQVISDFDFTLTRSHKNGEKCCSAHRIIDLSPLMSPEYAEKAKVLVDKYVPIEIDHKMTAEEKTPHIITWFRQSQVLLIDYQLTRDKIKEMIKTGNAHLRDLAGEVLSFLNDHNVPCLVFSAGLGDLVEALLHRDNVFFPNMKVIANYINFNEAGECVSFKEPLIHVYNKNATGLNNTAYFEQLSQRSNALVLGDSLGDVGMDKGMRDPGAVLKIGFLNEKINERMESFMNSYDVVLVDDQSFKFVDVVLKKIVPSTV